MKPGNEKKKNKIRMSKAFKINIQVNKAFN